MCTSEPHVFCVGLSVLRKSKFYFKWKYLPKLKVINFGMVLEEIRCVVQSFVWIWNPTILDQKVNQ